MTDRAFVSGRSTSITFGHISSFHHRRVQPRVSGDQSEDNAQFDGCDRRLDGLIHRSRCSNLHKAQTMVRSLALKPSGNGSRSWARKMCYIEIEPGSTRENDYCERFNAFCRDELLNGEISYTLREAQIVIEQWRRHYNTKRPHSALGYRPPAPESIIPMEEKRVMH